jgi:hypothetical protein
MKTLMRIVFLTLITVLIIQPVHGQRFLKKLQEKIEEKVEERAKEKVDERVEQKANEAIDNQIDKAEESLESENSGQSSGNEVQREERVNNILKGFGLSGEPVPIEDNYNFDHLIEMHIESFNKNGEKEEEGEFITHFNPGAKNMAYEMISGNISNPGQGVIIIDIDNGALIIVGEENGEKTGIAYGLKSFFNSTGEIYDEADPEGTPESYLANPNITKTGRTKTIAGYKCDEYKYSDEETESHIWITKDMKLGSRDYFSSLYKTSLYSRGIPWGAIMEVTSIDKDTGEKSFMEVTRVDDNSNKRFSMADYKISNLGSFKIPEEE